MKTVIKKIEVLIESSKNASFEEDHLFEYVIKSNHLINPNSPITIIIETQEPDHKTI